MNRWNRWIRWTLLLLCWLPTGCLQGPPPVTVGPPPTEQVPVEKVPTLTAVTWAEVEGWNDDDLGPALEVFRRGCRTLQKREGWQQVCTAAAALDESDPVAVRAYFEQGFLPYRVRNADGSETGLVTGYYVPELQGSRQQSARFAYPLYGVPDDLLVIDLRDVYPELGEYRLRGRVEGRRVVAYWDRAAIDEGRAGLAGKELFWVEDPVELFFLQVQGSGLLVLEDGSKVMVHYADQNGHPFRSIGKLLLERGEMSRAQMSMQNIKAWGRANPERVKSLLAENPSYVFFSEMPGNPQSPPGALGIPLTAERSIAVDPRSIALGVPVFLATSRPNRAEPLRRLMVAQDTGGAIKGAVRADFFWGMGDAAGALAGRMKQQGRMWVLLPLGVTPAGN